MRDGLQVTAARAAAAPLVAAPRAAEPALQFEQLVATTCVPDVDGHYGVQMGKIGAWEGCCCGC